VATRASTFPQDAAHAPAEKLRGEHIPSLDGLRAISFFIVFAAHAGLGAVVPGGFGVTVFFFLSGYLITTLMSVEVAKTGRVSLTAFYLRRALRILPPFYIVLVTMTGLCFVGFLRSIVPPQPLPVIAQMLHFSNYWIAFRGWGGVAPGTGVYWSLAVEEHFYLLFPAFYIALRRLGVPDRRKAAIFWAICALVLAWRTVLVFVLHSNVDRTYLCSDTRIDSILYGCALAMWKNPILTRGPSARSTPTRGRTLLVIGAVAVLLVTFVVRDNAFRETLRYSLQGVALTPIFLAAVEHPDWTIFRPLNWRPLRFLGALSYSLYLLHQGTLALVGDHLPLHPLAQAVVGFAIALTAAWAIYEWVEKPCARLRRRLSASLESGQRVLAVS
jgi:peptidoglycan/LPS O-acetylase OafA/YrhL